MSDLLRYNRHGLAGSLRRLAEAATEASAVVASDGCLPGEEDVVLAAVLGRIESVQHARQLLNATRAGARNAAQNRRTA